MSDYPAFGKIPRLNRPVLWTEKIDGTNGLIHIEESPLGEHMDRENPTDRKLVFVDGDEDHEYTVRAGSRNRWLTPGKQTDNYGFAAWVQENATTLADLLGPGLHYGEWWGQGIQRRYGLDHKRFSLFNAERYGWVKVELEAEGIGLDVVPILGTSTGFEPQETFLNTLREYGSLAAPGFQNPEGVVALHKASGKLYKVLLENDQNPKGS